MNKLSYLTPEAECIDLSCKKVLLVSGGADDMNPQPGTWALDEEEII